ncbi:uncharacterized protein LOC120415258 isoform X2 [Culex pipiens pallens]|nr:uncharacterized protein LOC120415258 isoform X2 [Culex pipiens pallens]
MIQPSQEKHLHVRLRDFLLRKNNPAVPLKYSTSLSPGKSIRCLSKVRVFIINSEGVSVMACPLLPIDTWRKSSATGQRRVLVQLSRADQATVKVICPNHRRGVSGPERVRRRVHLVRWDCALSIRCGRIVYVLLSTAAAAGRETYRLSCGLTVYRIYRRISVLQMRPKLLSSYGTRRLTAPPRSPRRVLSKHLPVPSPTLRKKIALFIGVFFNA